MKSIAKRGTMSVLYDPRTGEDLLLPAGCDVDHYIRKGFLTEPPEVSTLAYGYRPHTMLEHLAAARVVDGAWAGRPAYVIGGGPSLEDFDWDSLKGHLVVATNRAFEFCDPSIHVTLDYRYLEGVVSGLYGGRAHDRYLGLTCPKIIVATTGKVPPVGTLEVPRGPNFGWNERIEQGLATGTNSGFVGLQLAAMLGANPIYLLGFDMGGDHHHDGHPWPTDRECFRHYGRAFDQAAPRLEGAGIRVINLCPQSALHCFAKAMPVVEPSTMPLVVSYHTTDALYTKHASNLRRSLSFFGLEHRIEAMPPLDDWNANTQRKVDVIERALREEKRPVLWVDADATVERLLSLFEDKAFEKADIAFHMKDGKELLSGTVWIAPTKRGLALVQAWKAEIAAQPRGWDQGALQRAITKKLVKGLRVVQLPAEYCCIYDLMRGQCQEPPAILHWQASRQAKR